MEGRRSEVSTKSEEFLNFCRKAITRAPTLGQVVYVVQNAQGGYELVQEADLTYYGDMIHAAEIRYCAKQ